MHPATGAPAGSYGAHVLSDGVCFRLWAPSHDKVSIAIEGGEVLPMRPSGRGFHELKTRAAGPGTLYRFQLPDGALMPDPASRFQPEDVHGPSEVIDPGSYKWRSDDWRGRPWHEAIIYELHVGTFTEGGTFCAAIEKLDHLSALGVTAVQLMPVADFAGARNWGYDGVFLYAPDSSYGRPDDLKAFIDSAHRRGLMVFLDVVYNHFGPEGNCFPAFAPQVYTAGHKTPWGNAINFDGPNSRPVREFIIRNAIYWLNEFRFDGLRLDAVHSIIDDRDPHLLEELALRVRQSFDAGRFVHLILENEENESLRLRRDDRGQPVSYTAQWNDDLHHCLHAVATGEETGYYAEYKGDTAKLARSLAEGFAFQGEVMTYRGTARGEPCAQLPPPAFVSFIQNHDQVGNRAFGDRLTAKTPSKAVRAIGALYLLAPQIPMLFMGEEWGAVQPFPFFCDFAGELADAVRKGRRAEFAKFPEFQEEGARDQLPDPLSERTFSSAKLAWQDSVQEPHAGWLDWYRRILAVRRAEIVDRLALIGGNAGSYEVLRECALRVAWRLGEEGQLAVHANLSNDVLSGIAIRGRVLWSEGQVDLRQHTLGPWSVLWSISISSPGSAG